MLGHQKLQATSSMSSTSWVAGDWIVMVGLYYVKSELTIVGDIDFSSVEH